MWKFTRFCFGWGGKSRHFIKCVVPSPIYQYYYLDECFRAFVCKKTNIAWISNLVWSRYTHFFYKIDNLSNAWLFVLLVCWLAVNIGDLGLSETSKRITTCNDLVFIVSLDIMVIRPDTPRIIYGAIEPYFAFSVPELSFWTDLNM